MKNSKLRNRWLLLGGSGATLVGLGLSATIEVAWYKHSGGTTWIWVVLGTLSLSVFMVGLILLIKAGLLEAKSD